MRWEVWTPPLLTAVVVLLVWAGAKALFGVEDFKVPSPVGVRATYFWPSRVLILMSAREESPTWAPLVTVNATRTTLPCSETPSTLPTLTPAMRTSSPLLRPLASVKSAWYDAPPPMNGNELALNASSISTRIATMPMMPIGTGLRSRNGFTRSLRTPATSGR